MKVPEVLGVVGFLCLCLQSSMGEQITNERESLHVTFSTHQFLILTALFFFFPFLSFPVSRKCSRKIIDDYNL